MALPADLEEFLIAVIGPEKTGEVRKRQRRGQIGIELTAECLIYVFVDGRLLVQAMHVAGVMSDDDDVFVAERPLGLIGNLGPVEPHGLGHKPSVVGEDAVLHVDEIL